MSPLRPLRTRTLVGGTAGAVLGLYPGMLPRTAAFEGAVIGTFTAVGIAAAALLCTLIAACRRSTATDRPRPSRLVVTGCAGAVVAALAWAAQWRVMAMGIPGLTGAALRYWAVALSVAATVAGLSAALGALAPTMVRAVFGATFRHRAHDTGSLRRPRNPRIAARAAASLALVLAVAAPIGVGPATADAASPAAGAAVGGAGAPPAPSAASASSSHGRRFAAGVSSQRSIRIYAGLDTAPDPDSRAEAAADALARRGGMDASAVVVMIPTGSGWVDPAAARAFEERFGGNVAEVAMQYADVPSWVEYVLDLDGAEAAAHSLIAAIAGRLSRLPAADRPDLYVYGESLGAAAGSRALADAPRARAMLCRALWVGPPGGFADPTPRRSTVVTNATDPVPRWSPQLAVRPAPRPPGHPSAAPPWVPLASFLQTSADLLVSRAGASGTGHVYGAQQIDGLRMC